MERGKDIEGLWRGEGGGLLGVLLLLLLRLGFRLGLRLELELLELVVEAWCCGRGRVCGGLK